MTVSFLAMTAAYVLSMFYRAFLAVLSPALEAEIGATPAHLATASGLWFLSFALVQIPIGMALDRFGPRRTAAPLLAVGAIGALIFAMAQGPGTIKFAMCLIGIGCAPVLMAALYTFGRRYSAAVFASMAGLVIGLGNIGNLGASLPLSLAVDAFGWRGTMLGLSLITGLVALAMWLLIEDLPPAEKPAVAGSILDVLRNPAIWAVLILLFANYAPAAAIRGLWAGPYFSQLHGAGNWTVGVITLLMGIGMVIGSFAYAPVDRVFGSRKWPAFVGNFGGGLILLVLWWHPVPDMWLVVGLMVGVCTLGMSYALLVAHGRAFVPPHLLGRGMTILNLASIAGVGSMQLVSGRIYDAGVQAGHPPEVIFSSLFGFLAVLLLAGSAIYGVMARDRVD